MRYFSACNPLNIWVSRVLAVLENWACDWKDTGSIGLESRQVMTKVPLSEAVNTPPPAGCSVGVSVCVAESQHTLCVMSLRQV